MRTLKVKISGISTAVKPQIEWGPYEEGDIIALALVNVLSPDYLDELVNAERARLVNQTSDIKEYEYDYN